MARRIDWADPAWADLESAADYIARDSPSYAAAFVQEVKQAVDSLSELADRGQIVPEFRDPTIRELLVKPYRVVYQVLPTEVRIVAVIHGSRRLRR
jgi:plasmid stabilization system protein ParE